ncbi:MAG: carboxypeptidase-like regulatory domain-containing protein, partial [bacterium]
MFRKLLALFCLILLFLPAAGQHYRLSGTVSNDETGGFLPGANILMSDGYLATISGSDGSFSFEKLKKGNYTITVSYVGYKTYETTVDLNKDINLKIRLTPKTYVSEEVIISAIRAGSTPKTTY